MESQPNRGRKRLRLVAKLLCGLFTAFMAASLVLVIVVVQLVRAIGAAVAAGLVQVGTVISALSLVLLVALAGVLLVVLQSSFWLAPFSPFVRLLCAAISFLLQLMFSR